MTTAPTTVHTSEEAATFFLGQQHIVAAAATTLGTPIISPQDIIDEIAILKAAADRKGKGAAPKTELPVWLPSYINEDWCLAHSTLPRIAATPPPPPVTIACDHPQRLAAMFALPATTSWDESARVARAYINTVVAICGLFTPTATIATILGLVQTAIDNAEFPYAQELRNHLRLLPTTTWAEMTHAINQVFARLAAPLAGTWSQAMDRITSLVDHQCVATAS